MSISFCRFAVPALLFLVGSCLSQEKARVDQTEAIPVVQKLLSGAQLSGALEYWGLCDISQPRSPEFRLHPISGHEGSALDALQEIFANDDNMRVTQASDGKIRMVETDVPKDFLEVKIHRLLFDADNHGSGMALYTILHTPEVLDFMDHNIGSNTAWEGWGLPSDFIFVHKPSVRGELNDVTVAQALDYVLQTFPGFWTYQSCRTPEGQRKISVGFNDNVRLVSDTTVTKSK
jgi:hypothetical protein